jgi:uncharacterized protein YukJ
VIAMTLAGYGVLVGRAVGSRAEQGSDSPHFQVQVEAAGTQFRVAVNVLSQESPSELLYLADEAFEHPVLAALPGLGDGFTELASAPGGTALDFIRGNLFDPTQMKPVPATAPGPDNDLADKLDHFVSRAVGDATARLYAFGQRWGPEQGKPDAIFGFSPGNGVHDIHMNQGNTGRFREDDGVWQDGALVLHFPSADQWVGIFLAFQSQAWHTDDRTGHALQDPTSSGRIRIVGALVNPVGPAPEKESVTLLNASSEDVDLGGWAVLDKLKQRMPLDSGVLAAGETLKVPLEDPVQLGNGGGLVTLVDQAGLKVDGVAYTGEQAAQEGWTLVF